METHVHTQVHWHPRRASDATTKVLQVGAVAAIASGFIMAAWQMVVAAIAQNRTTVHGIHQTLRTPPEGIWSVAFGVHHFHGSFHFIPVFGGIVGHMGTSLIRGIMGVALLTAILGRRPNPVAAFVIGAAYVIAGQATSSSARAGVQSERNGGQLRATERAPERCIAARTPGSLRLALGG